MGRNPCAGLIPDKISYYPGFCVAAELEPQLEDIASMEKAEPDRGTDYNHDKGQRGAVAYDYGYIHG